MSNFSTYVRLCKNYTWFVSLNSYIVEKFWSMKSFGPMEHQHRFEVHKLNWV